jgi:hypothetical protein
LHSCSTSSYISGSGGSGLQESPKQSRKDPKSKDTGTVRVGRNLVQKTFQNLSDQAMLLSKPLARKAPPLSATHSTDGVWIEEGFHCSLPHDKETRKETKSVKLSAKSF